MINVRIYQDGTISPKSYALLKELNNRISKGEWPEIIEYEANGGSEIRIQLIEGWLSVKMQDEPPSFLDKWKKK